MSKGGDTRFQPGHSGNPNGRPKARRPHVSAFDIIFDRTLTVTQGGMERELTIDEALELQTYQAALKGSRMAIRKVLKMIEKREMALAKRQGKDDQHMGAERVLHYSAENAHEAMRILGIMERDPAWGDEHPREKLATWVTQAALSRPGSRRFRPKDIDDIKMFTMDADTLKWPRGKRA